MPDVNSYEDARRADAYAKLEFPGTYYLAFRDIPAIVEKHVKGQKAMDFGCGTGRSTRFLQKLGFDVVGVDIAADMLDRARALDTQGDYRLVEDGDLSCIKGEAFDLALSVFTFDNIPTMAKKVTIFKQLGEELNDNGRIISLVSDPAIYTHEWASFSTRDFPENRQAKSGDKVKIIITDVEDGRPVEDTVWSHEAYLTVYAEAGLEVVTTYRPLAREDEPFQWVNETTISPWVIYVLKRVPEAV